MKTDETTREEIKKHITRFKMDMLKLVPFYGDIMLRIGVSEDENIPTACTNGLRIKYNPDFFAGLSAGERNYVYMHEVLHVLFLHWKRKSDRDSFIWNAACDYVVNNILDGMKLQMDDAKLLFERPQGLCVLPYYFEKDKSAEEYYNLLTDGSERNKRYIKLGLLIEDLPDDGWELSDAEAREAEQIIREYIKEAAGRAGEEKSRKIPDGLLELTESKVLPWNRLLKEFMTERIKEASYYTPERKYIHMGLIIPGESKEEDELGDIWAFVDASGSINQNQMNQFITQLYRISKEFHCKVNLAFWDTKVVEVHKNIDRADKLLKIKRRYMGGTDINCVYRYIKEENIKPEVMIVLTDGYYGTLKESAGKLRKKTILVLSPHGCRQVGKNNEIGRLARL